MRTVLGIDVDDALLRDWRSWLCPERRPFRVDLLPPAIAAQVPVHPGRASDEIRDAFFLYAGTWAWLDEVEFLALPVSVRGTSLDDEPGTVLLWREHGRPSHAAITLGGGHALSKPSQSWSSPRLVWTVRETIASARWRSSHLSRRRLR